MDPSASGSRGRNFQRVITLVRLARVLLILFIAFFTVSFVIGLGSRDTGAVEKVALLALIAGCVFLAAKVSTLATKTQSRLQRR
jgi:membrane associated rhomboid family serine protease